MSIVQFAGYYIDRLVAKIPKDKLYFFYILNIFNGKLLIFTKLKRLV